MVNGINSRPQVLLPNDLSGPLPIQNQPVSGPAQAHASPLVFTTIEKTKYFLEMDIGTPVTDTHVAALHSGFLRMAVQELSPYPAVADMMAKRHKQLIFAMPNASSVTVELSKDGANRLATWMQEDVKFPAVKVSVAANGSRLQVSIEGNSTWDKAKLWLALKAKGEWMRGKAVEVIETALRGRHAPLANPQSTTTPTP